MQWQWPRLTLRRTEAGRVSVPDGLAVGVLVVVIASTALWTAMRWTGASGGGPSTSGASQGAPLSEQDCARSRNDPGPLIDLGVQPATLDRTQPLLSVEQVRDLVRLAKGAGADIISTTASFRALKPSRGADYRFEGMDRVIDEATRLGLQVRLRLTGVPMWAIDDYVGDRRQPPETEAELTRWRTFVKDLMVHVRGRVQYVDVWVQPNSQKYWPTGPDPVEFMRLLATTYDVVHETAPETQVVSGGLLGNDIGYLEKMYDAADVLGLDAMPFDLLGVQPFTGAESPTLVDPARRYDQEPFGAFDENFTGFTSLHDVLADHGDASVPIFISSFGYSTRRAAGAPGVPDTLRAEYLTDAFGAATCASYVAALSWYAFHPTPWDPESWTLLNSEDRPNKTYAALVRWARGR
jgi:hypothetical protein